MNLIFLRSSAWTPAKLFAAGEEGVWYDPSDLSTMWQDTARTTAVTAVEQTVACIDDKSGNGNNATQSTSGSRPVLRARYNLFTYSEEFNNAAWSKNAVTVSANSIAAPDGTTTADTLIESATTANHFMDDFLRAPSGYTAGRVTFICYAKAKDRTAITLASNQGLASQWAAATFDLSGGTVSQSGAGAGGAYTSVSTSITDVGSGWYRCSLTFTVSGAHYPTIQIVDTASYSYQDFGRYSYAGDGTSGVYIWGADLRMTNDAAGMPVYQRVAAATDYDTTGFLPYLAFDGSDDGLATSAIDFSGTDAVTVIAGVRKLSDAARGSIVELTASAAANDGSFQLTAPNAASATYAFESKGTALTDAVVSTGVTAPISSVLTAYSDISADQNILRVNGAQVDSDTGDQGTGNFSNAVLYIGRRGGASLPFNGRLYGLVVRGATSSAGEITSAESWMNRKTAAY